MAKKKCGEKTEFYSRVTGYFRPVSNWNKGKKEEFAERKTFRVVGRTAVFLGLFLLLAILAGCGTMNQLAKGLSEKSISGSGTVAIQRVGIDDETKTPVLKSTVITGDYASAHNGDYAFQYRRKKSPSIFNKDAITEEVTINYIGTKEQALEALELAKKDVATAGSGENKAPEAAGANRQETEPGSEAPKPDAAAPPAETAEKTEKTETADANAKK